MGRRKAVYKITHPYLYKPESTQSPKSYDPAKVQQHILRQQQLQSMKQTQQPQAVSVVSHSDTNVNVIESEDDDDYNMNELVISQPKIHPISSQSSSISSTDIIMPHR